MLTIGWKGENNYYQLALYYFMKNVITCHVQENIVRNRTMPFDSFHVQEVDGGVLYGMVLIKGNNHTLNVFVISWKK